MVPHHRATLIPASPCKYLECDQTYPLSNKINIRVTLKLQIRRAKGVHSGNSRWPGFNKRKNQRWATVTGRRFSSFVFWIDTVCAPTGDYYFLPNSTYCSQIYSLRLGYGFGGLKTLIYTIYGMALGILI